MPSGGSRCATGRDDSVPSINNKVPAWIPPSAIKREALHKNIDSDEEELFRKVRGLLNKLTPEKFEKLSVEFCNLSIKNPKALKGIIVLILDKALTETAYSDLYAELCQRLDKWVPNFEIPNKAINSSNNITTFRKLLLTVCQHEFDNRSNYTTSSIVSNINESANFTNSVTVIPQNFSDDEKKAQLELARQNAKKKMLGNVKFIGELGRIDLLTEAILHKCIKTLLEKQRDEKYSDMSEDLECLCKMMPTIGKKLDQGEAIKLMDQYFERMKKLIAMKSGNEYALPMRIRFMLQDLIDLRTKLWQPRKTQVDQTPKSMHEVRNGAFMEEMAAAALAASSREAQEAAAQACFNISSLNLTSNSVLMMNMYQKLSQQPNVSLLNAINTKIATNKINNSQQKQETSNKPIYSNEYEIMEKNNDSETDLSVPNVNSVALNNNEINLVTRQTSSKQNFIKQLATEQTEQHSYNSVQKTNFSFQRGLQRQNYNSLNQNNSTSTTDYQKLMQNKNKNYFNSNKKISSDSSDSTQNKSIVNQNYTKNLIKPKSSSNFTWKNQPHQNISAISEPSSLNQQVKAQPNMQSISSSSSPFSSTSSLSASPPLPITDQGNTASTAIESNKSKNLVNSSATSTAKAINQKSSIEQAAIDDIKYQQTSCSRNISINNQQSNSNRITNVYNNSINISNSNNHNNRQGYPQQNSKGTFYQHSNHNIAKNALGVSTNDVLPLNKPIIPLEKITKYDHSSHNKISVVNSKSKTPLNIFNKNIYNLTSQSNLVNQKKQQKNQILDEATKKQLLLNVDKFLMENKKNVDNNSELTEEIMNDIFEKIKELKLSNDKLSEAIRIIITHSLSKDDIDRLKISQLFIRLHNLETESGLHFMSSEIFINGLKTILQNLSNLESEYHCVKSNISMFAARAVCDQILTFDDLGSMMRHGNHYPLFFLCMQNIHKIETKDWLRSQLEKSKINLLEMLPSSDRHKDRLIQILEDRELSFVYPMLKIESSLLERIQSNSLNNNDLKQWIEANVSVSVTQSNDFIHSLVTCIVKNAAENSVLSTENSDLNSKMDKNQVAKQKQLIQTYQSILQEYLASGVKKMRISKQIEAINAMQVYANSKGFPKYFLAHLFNQMYDLEIIEEDAFLQWKDEINENYPNKGQALFYLQRWFNWLQEASEESSGSETEGLSEKNPKSSNSIKKNNDQIEV